MLHKYFLYYVEMLLPKFASFNLWFKAHNSITKCFSTKELSGTSEDGNGKRDADITSFAPKELIVSVNKDE